MDTHSMQIILSAIVTIVSIIAAMSFVVIRHVSKRPANGELKTLARLDTKITNHKRFLHSL